jgi:hypothetical protein
MFKYSSNYLLIISFFLSIYFHSGCGGEDQKELERERQLRDSLAVQDSLAKIIPELKITYSFLQIEGLKTLTDLTEKYGDEGRYLILALNRLDNRNLPKNDSLIIPDTILTDFLKYSPFPSSIESINDIKKILFISRKIQAFAGYEFGELVKWGPTSTGKKSTPTPTGLYHTNWKSKLTISTVNKEWLLPWAFNLDNFQGISVHEFDMPGFPASHACARLLQPDAEWFYYWAEQWILTPDESKIIAHGTPVIIFDDYDFESFQPWKNLIENSDTARITESEINLLMNEYKSLIMDRAAVRDSVIQRREAIADSLANK